MHKKTTYLLTLLALSSSTAAYAANSGFYVGVDGGRDTGTIKTDYTTSTRPASVTPVPLDGFLWGVHGGYNWFLTQQFVLGTELFWNRSTASDEYQGAKDLTLSNSIGASLLPGWQLDSKNRLYARLGWIQSQFSNISDGQTLESQERAFQNTRSNGIELGAGYLVTLVNQWDLRMEYDYAYYQSLEINTPNSNNNYSFKPVFDRYTLGLNYNFDPTQIKFADTIKPSFNGWYGGAALGRDNTSMNMQSNENGDTLQERRGLSGNLGQMQVGYDWQFAPHGVLGIEAFGLLNTADGTTTEAHGHYEKTIDWQEQDSFGASLLPGYQLNPSNLLYLRVGYIASRFSYTPVVLVHEASISFDTTKPGLQLGLGYAVRVLNNWSVFGEYDYAQYASIHAESTVVDSHYYDIKPTDNQYKLGVNYYF